MRRNHVKVKLEAGQATFGFYTSFPSPDLLEFMGHLGFEFVWLDNEHAPMGVDTTVHLVRACETVGVVPIMRVSANDPAQILSYLEIGIMGIMVPHVNTAEDARRVVAAVRYRPQGRRGAGSHSRAASFGLTQTAVQYFEQANKETLVIPLIEEPEGFENLPEICEVDGVDIVAFGPGDLAMAMGHPGNSGHPDVQKVIRRAEHQVVESGKTLDAIVADTHEAHQALGRGARFISIGVQTILREGGRAFLEGLRA
jgi:4-hydroxy-2-oxoheptanedioate aldolase